jgi:hypothetical protein
MKSLFFGSARPAVRGDSSDADVLAHRYLATEVEHYDTVLAPALAENPVRWLSDLPG